MAKSNFEPKKIVRYAESNIPKQGISSIPAPRTQRSTPSIAAGDTGNSSLSSTGTTGTSVVTGGSSTPPPPPPPPAVAEETRAFVFDGSTELTASFSTAGGSRINDYSAVFTVSPAWGPEDTGSFVVFSIGNPSDGTDHRTSLYFERTSGSGGYQDLITSELTSGSVLYKTSMLLSNSPNFHNVSASNTGFAVYVRQGNLDTAFQDNSGIGFRAGTKFVDANNSNNSDRYNAATTILDSTNYTLSIGGYNSGSNGYMTGSMDNLYISKKRKWLQSHPLSKHTDKNQPVHIFYTFEGNVLASKGGKDLTVVGTETYVSSSL